MHLTVFSWMYNSEKEKEDRDIQALLSHKPGCPSGVLQFYEQPGFFQSGPHGQIEDGCGNHCHHCVHAGGEGGDFGQRRGDVLGHSQQVGLVEIAYHGVCHHVEGHAAEAGGDGGDSDFLRLPGIADMEDSMGHQACDQADAELQEEGLGRAGHIGGGQVADGHAHSPRKAAPVAAQQQRRQHAEHIAEVECGLLRPYRDVDFEESEADVAQRRQEPGLGQALHVGFPGAVCARQRIVDALCGQQNGEEDQRQTVGIGTLQRQFLVGQSADLRVQGLQVAFRRALFHGACLCFGFGELRSHNGGFLIAGMVRVHCEDEACDQQHGAHDQQAVAFLFFLFLVPVHVPILLYVGGHRFPRERLLPVFVLMGVPVRELSFV